MSRALDLQTHLQQQQSPIAAEVGEGHQGRHNYGDDDYVGGYNDSNEGTSGGGGSGDGNNTKDTSTSASQRSASSSSSRSNSTPSRPPPLPLSSKKKKLSPGQMKKLSPGHMARLCSSSDLVWPTAPFLRVGGSGSVLGGAAGSEIDEGENKGPFAANSVTNRAHRASSLSLLQPLAEGLSHLRHAVATSPSPDSASSSRAQNSGFFFDHDDDHRHGDDNDDNYGYDRDDVIERRRSSGGSGSSLPSFPIQLGRGGASAKQLRDLSFDSSEEEGFTTWKGSAEAAAQSPLFRGSMHTQASSLEDGLISDESLTF